MEPSQSSLGEKIAIDVELSFTKEGEVVGGVILMRTNMMKMNSDGESGPNKTNLTN